MRDYNNQPNIIARRKAYSHEYHKRRLPRPPRDRSNRKPQLNRVRKSKAGKLWNLNKIGISDLYVYFINVKGTCIYKIGVTNNPLKRVEVLQTGCPFDISLKMAFVTPNAVTEEKRIHKELLQFKRRGEWFNLTSDHLDRIKSQLQ